MQIYSASPQLMGGKEGESRPDTKYPFAKLNIGQCFLVPLADDNRNNLKSLCNYHGKRLGVKFRVITHRSRGVYEIGRIA